jgi:hypothetical protein
MGKPKLFEIIFFPFRRGKIALETNRKPSCSPQDFQDVEIKGDEIIYLGAKKEVRGEWTNPR